MSRSLGLSAAMPLAHARSLVPNLRIEPADLYGDAAALAELAAWCLRFSPLTAPDGPDGIWIDATGCACLFEGELALLTTIANRLTAAGTMVRIAIADTPGAAWAVSRRGQSPISVVPQGAAAASIRPLPV